MKTIKVIENEIKVCDVCQKELNEKDDENPYANSNDENKYYSCQICKKDLCDNHAIEFISEGLRHVDVWKPNIVCQNCYDIHLKPINEKLKVLMDEVDKIDDEMTEKFFMNR